jgi:nucleoside-diphosphate-sugar epimerase
MDDTFSPVRPHVLVTGAAGFTGSVLVRKLAARGAAVRALIRPGKGPAHMADLPARRLSGSILEPHDVAAAVTGVSHIYHLATLFRSPHVGYHELYDVHVRATMLLAEAAARQRPMPRFVHVSTVGVHGHVTHPPADEDYRFSPGDDYQATKAEAEIQLREFARREGLPVTIVRPAPIYGPGDRRLYKIFWMVARSLVLSIGSGRQLYHLVHVDDLTDFILHVGDLPEAAGEVYICAGDEPCRFDDLVRVIAEHYDRSPRMLRLPAGPALAFAATCEKVLPRIGIRPPLFSRRVHFFLSDRAFSTAKMLATGFRPQHPTRDGLRQTAQWYLDQGWIRLGRRSAATVLRQGASAAALAAEPFLDLLLP